MAKADQFPPAKDKQSASRKRVSKPLGEIAVHPSLAADVRQLIARHGREAVQEAIRKETKRKAGRPVKPDRYLVELLTPDAERWLENMTPFAVETDNAIAEKAEAVYPDRDSNILSGSQKNRILIRLRARRYYYTLVLAWYIGQEKYPYTDSLRAVNALADLGILQESWRQMLKIVNDWINEYRDKFGEPAATLTMRDIENRLRRSA